VIIFQFPGAEIPRYFIDASSWRGYPSHAY